MADQESLLIWGPWQEETRKTFQAAQPILEKLPDSVDRLFMLYLVREQTWIAMKYPDSEQRKIEAAWVILCRSIETFLNVTFRKASKELSDDLQIRRAGAEEAGTSIAWWPSVGDIKPSPELSEALNKYSETLGLPVNNHQKRAPL